MSLDSIFGGGDDASDAAEKSAEAQVEATKLSNETIERMFNLGRMDQAPWRIGGGNALMAMMDMMGLQRPTMNQITAGISPTPTTAPTKQQQIQATNSIPNDQYMFQVWGPDNSPVMVPIGQITNALSNTDATKKATPTEPQPVDPTTSANQYKETLAMPKYNWQTSPGYGWRMSEGINAINKSAAGRGSLLSGATLKSLNKYGQGLASEEYGNVFNRLAGMAGVGSNTANQSAAAANQTGQAMGQNILSAGDARASGYINAANAKAQGSQNMLQNIIGLGGLLGSIF